jgi:hypothetical protein
MKAGSRASGEPWPVIATSGGKITGSAASGTITSPSTGQ